VMPARFRIRLIQSTWSASRLTSFRFDRTSQILSCVTSDTSLARALR
jgi:hypothetical protein